MQGGSVARVSTEVSPLSDAQRGDAKLYAMKIGEKLDEPLRFA
jgi:hypothetical protein